MTSLEFAAITAISASIFAYFGAGWLKTLSNETLTRIFGTNRSIQDQSVIRMEPRSR